jgi:UDP-N-acetylmuramyl pentapeptide phosphotransferase/UDP-N-acetylglucosamine-1-phosphate transferase
MGLPALGWIAASAALCAAIVAAAVAYAHRRGLLDQPGRRRSHRRPTPRGGGIGIVVAVLLLGFGPAAVAGDRVASALAVALLAVAAIGWWDDHRPLGARARLLVHAAAATLAAAAVLGAPQGPAGVLLFGVAVLGVAWSINLHNFIDGIDGLLASQALVLSVALASAFAFAGQGEWARWCAVAAAACFAFLPFNLPRARIFLGDVGSGALGLLLGALALVAWRGGALDAGAILMLASACAVDATATLLSRMLRGRRWWKPHREHLYQWLVRRGASHLRVTLAYLGWTALVVPALLAARESAHASAWAGAHPRLAESLYFAGWPAATLATAVLLWWAGKRACLRHARIRNPRCASPS